MATDISNDTRGWILCAISSIACVAGACIVCVDIFIRMLPGMKTFNIQDSSAFLSASLSLSFGVMIFSSLFSMLPSSKKYLINDGQIEQVAGLLMIVGFGGGFVGMQIVSRIIHRFMPSHVVDCDHTHEDDAEDEDGDLHDHNHAPGHSHGHSHDHHHDSPESTHLRVGNKPRSVNRKYFRQGSNPETESTPLLAGVDGAMANHLSSATQPDVQRQVSLTRSDVPVGAAHTAASAATPQHYDDAEATSMPALRPRRSLTSLRRPSMMEVRNRVISFVKDVKSNCDEFGPCYGYTDPCGQECKRNIALRAPAAIRSAFTHPPKQAQSTSALARDASGGLEHPNWEASISVVPEESSGDISSSSSSRNNNDAVRSASPGASGTVRRHHAHHDPRDNEEIQEGEDADFTASAGESSTNVSDIDIHNNTNIPSKDNKEHQHSQGHSRHSHHGHHAHDEHEHEHGHEHEHNHDHDHYYGEEEHEGCTNMGAHGDGTAEEEDLEAAHSHGHASVHHHHVPANAFLSIGLQTVLAIGLHKLPEGFITFATNHANPALGFNVFLALFVHNIAEGFAMALPLYMALGSRLRAIAWATALGGLSQPIGAACAAVWLRYLAHRNDARNGGGGDSDEDPGTANGTAYGILFAITGGIMVAVALQLFVEGLTIHHNRQLTIGFAFLGMMLLGLCNAIGTH
ncbi:Zinc transporter [Sporothrix curviconia]|uniref:Zinc transporter n=1 Tax=Sporothrix curviconia TaxID=1260050 RepID=A0ABP0BDY2_9PEZI